MFYRLHKLNLTVSYKMVIRLLDDFGKDHDMKVQQWRDSLKNFLSSSMVREFMRLFYSCYSVCMHVSVNILN